MTTLRKKAVIVWVSGFLTFYSAIFSLRGSILWWQLGDGYIMYNVKLLGIIPIFRELRIELYFGLWTAATFLFLGITCFFAFRRTDEMASTPLSQVAVDPARISGMYKSLESYRKSFLDFLRTLSETRINQTRSVEEVNETLKKLVEDLEEVKKMVKVLGEVADLRAKLKDLETVIETVK